MKNNKYFNFNKSLDQDFENIYISTRYLWKNFKRKKIFITGGTGFFGYWLIRSFIYANEKLKLNSKIYVLTRKKNIFIPKNRKRGNLKNLKILSSVFENAWILAKKTNYWEAMIINGLATSSILNSDPKIIIELIEKGALGASVSGNGPAIAAITKKGNEANIKKVFSTLDGNIIVSKISNKKAEVYEL